MEQLCVTDTPYGPMTFVLRRKKIKNLNLRISPEGQVLLSVPLGCPQGEAERLIRERADWIEKVRASQRRAAPSLPPPPQAGEAEALLRESLDRVYPLVRPLGVDYPQLKLRRMKSQWGNCHWRQGYITLNTALARCPQPLRDYVALHELVHFLAPNHGPAFYAYMSRLMPDWQARRRTLREYGAALSG